jgi:hypothetical protein
MRRPAGAALAERQADEAVRAGRAADTAVHGVRAAVGHPDAGPAGVPGQEPGAGAGCGGFASKAGTSGALPGSPTSAQRAATRS